MNAATSIHHHDYGLTREGWLELLANSLRPDFHAAGHPLPDKIRYSCGWPSIRPSKRIGECWDRSASKDDHFELFISPAHATAFAAADTLVHELCHAAVGCACGHKTPFKKAARAMGLEGKLTSTHAGEMLSNRLHAALDVMPPYPHSQLPIRNPDKKKQTTRMLKLQCSDCGYTVRTTQKWVDVGLPFCPDHDQLSIAEDGGEDNDG